jgi:hypothetical protein
MAQGKKANPKSTKQASGKVVTIKLTPEQQRSLYEQTNGRITAKVLKLRPDLDLSRFLDGLQGIGVSGRVTTRLAPPPKDTYWV